MEKKVLIDNELVESLPSFLIRNTNIKFNENYEKKLYINVYNSESKNENKIDMNKDFFKSNNKMLSSPNKQLKIKENFDFLTFSLENQIHIEIIQDCIKIYETLTDSNFYSPSEFYLYYKEKINNINKEKSLNGKERINILIKMWNELELSSKMKYIDRANEISCLIMRKKFDKEESFFVAVRYEIISEKLILKIKNDFLYKKCLNCWLINKFCICNKIKKLDFKSNLFIVMHNKEFLRASNSSKILSLIKLKDSLLNLTHFIIGLWEHEDKLKKLFKDENFIKNSIILYPDKDSICSAEFYQKTTINFIDDKKKIRNFIENLNIFVIDGTWSQTSNLKKYLDECCILKDKKQDEKINNIFNIDELDQEKLNNLHQSSTASKKEIKSPVELNKDEDDFYKPIGDKIISISIKFDHMNKKNIFENLRKTHSDELCSTVEALGILLSDLEYEKYIYQTIMENMKLLVENLCIQNRKKLD